MLLALVLASRKAAVSVVTGKRIAFRAVLGKIWLYGLGLGFGTVGFGVNLMACRLFRNSRFEPINTWFPLFITVRSLNSSQKEVV